MDNERTARVLQMFKQGFTYRAIAEEVGISRQRVQQIVRPPRIIYDAVKAAAQGKCQACGILIANGHVHHLDRTRDDIDSLAYLCPSCHGRSDDTLGVMPGPPVMLPPKNEAASSMAKLRWSRIPAEERSKHVPRNGGRRKAIPVTE